MNKIDLKDKEHRRIMRSMQRQYRKELRKIRAAERKAARSYARYSNAICKYQGLLLKQRVRAFGEEKE